VGSSERAGVNNTATGSLPKVWREAGFWCLIVSTLLYFLPVLALGRTLYFRDIYLFYLPLKTHLATLLSTAAEPYWLELLNGGQPLWSNPVYHVLYPAHLLYLLLDPLTGFNADVAAHIALAAGGTYFLARVLGMSPWPSVVAAATFAFSGYALSLVSLLNRLYSFAPAPLLLACWHLYWRDRRVRWGLAAAAVEAAQWFSGGAEFALMSCVLVTAWTFVYPYRTTTWRQRLLPLAVLQVLIAGAIAVQVVPAIPLIRGSARSGHMTYESFSTWSVHPTRLPEVVIPGFFGRTDTLNDADYWGRERESNGFPYVLSLYIGALPLSLALLAMARGASGVLPRAPRILLGALGCGGFVFALGGNLPGWELVYQHLPFVTAVRYPVKLMAAAMLPLALLAGTAAHEAFRPSEEGRRFARDLVACLALVGVGLVAVITVLTAFPSAALRLEQHLFLTSSPAITQGLLAASSKALLVWGVGFLVLLHRLTRHHHWQSFVLAAVVVVDLLSAGTAVNPTAPREALEGVPPVVTVIRESGQHGRLFRDPVPAGVILRAPSNDPIHQYRWNLDVLNFYLCWAYGIPAVLHSDFDLMAGARIRSMRELVLDLPWDRRLPLLSAAGVRWVISHRRLQLPELELVQTIPNQSNLVFYLYLNRSAPPLATWVPTARWAASQAQAWVLMQESGFDPRNTVVLEGPQSTSSLGPTRGSQGPPVADRHRLVLLERSASSWSATLDSPTEGYLVFSESYDPGWRVLLDGEVAPVIPANGAFSAVAVPAGFHQVERRYTPPGLIVGAVISVLSVGLLVGTVLLLTPRRLQRATQAGA
jgi:hypothetical protein